MTYQFCPTITNEENDAFVSTHPLCNLLQSSKWAIVKHNWKHAIVGVKNENQQVIASASILIKALPLNFTMFYIPRGPIMDYEDEQLVTFFFSELKKYAKGKHCLFIKLDTGIIKNQYHLEDKTDDILPEAQAALTLLKKVGCKHLGFSTDMSATIQPRFQAPVFFDEQFEEHLPRHTKRHIATARKKHVTVETYGTDTLEAFSRLMKLTEERKNVALRSEDYFELLMDTYGKEDAKMYLAKIDLEALLVDTKQRLVTAKRDLEKCKPEDEKKQATFIQSIQNIESEIKDIEQFIEVDGKQPFVAAALTVFFGDTAEMLYMGMDGKYRKYMAAYLSHLTPMLQAFERGCRICNMGGLEGTLDGGLTKFKDNFNPTILEYLGEFEFPVNTLLYQFAHWAFNIRKKMLHRS